MESADHGNLCGRSEGIAMNQTTLDEIRSDLREIKAILAQCGLVRLAPSVSQEIAACRAQGKSVAEYFKDKGKRAPRKQKEAKR